MLGLCILLLGVMHSLFAQKTMHTFAIGEKDFLLDGTPFQIRSGEMHHERIPKEYWRHRLKMVHAMGCNTVCAYLFWNRIEPNPGTWNFNGSSDVAEYCRIAHEEGLKVILRPGPYSCAEWEFGGFPWWLLKNPDIKLRTCDSIYLTAVRSYILAVGKELSSLQWTHGGPIIMVQVENEYGSYGTDKEYIGLVRDYLREAGFEVPLFTCDGPSQLKNDVRDDIFCVVNFGDDPEGSFNALRKIRSTGPLMCGEYYPGWFDSWGKKHHTGSTETVIKDLRYMLDHNASFSIYMVHGGTTFGFNAGANCPPFSPQTTSYDYDAPINENGVATPKYFAIRDLFSKYLLTGETLPDPPPPNPIITIPKIELTKYASVMENLGEPIHVVDPQPMEMFDQGSGCILYRTTLPPGPACILSIKQVHDYAILMLNGNQIGITDRRKKIGPITIPARSEPSTLDILVETMGRVNYGDYLHDRKGITQSVEIIVDETRQPLKGWDVFTIPLDDNCISNLKASTGTVGPSFYRGIFELEKIGDSFLDLRTWNKGIVWINGHNLGRYWNIGPQQTLYLPAPWLKEGKNEILIFDLGENVTQTFIEGRMTPILDDVREELPRPHRQSGQRINLDGMTPVASGSFVQGPQPQRVDFQPVTARYICFESLNSQAADSFASCAELNIIDSNNKPLSRTYWKIIYASSEELESEDGSAENVLDDDTETIWHTEWGKVQPSHPHQIVIDLGKPETFSSFEYTPRPGGNHPGRIKDFKIYISVKPFAGL